MNSSTMRLTTNGIDFLDVALPTSEPTIQVWARQVLTQFNLSEALEFDLFDDNFKICQMANLLQPQSREITL